MVEANIHQNPTVATNATTEGPITLTVTGIINDLNEGIDRDGIATKYGLTKAEVTELFKHPKLTGLRARKKIPVRFTLVDDTVIPASTVEADPNQLTIMDVEGINS
jgi:hypothetical protein